MELHKDQHTGEIVAIRIDSKLDVHSGVWELVETILMREDVIKANYASDPRFVESFADDIGLVLRGAKRAPTKISETYTVHGKDIKLQSTPLPPDTPTITVF